MELLLVFFIANFICYVIWRIRLHFYGFDIQHNSIMNFAVTLLFFLPLQLGGYLDIEQ